MRRYLLDSLRIVSTLGTLAACVYAFPVAALIAEKAVSAQEFVILFSIPGVVSVAIDPTLRVIRARRVLHPILTITWAGLEGLALGLSLVGLMALFQWYSNPTASHLEPLALLFAAAATAAGVVRRQVRYAQSKVVAAIADVRVTGKDRTAA